MSLTSITLDPLSAEALQHTTLLANLIPATVTFQSAGHVLIIGPEDRVRLAAAQLGDMRSCTLVINQAITRTDDAHLAQVMIAAEQTEALACYHATHIELSGYLGQFMVSIEAPQHSLPLQLLPKNSGQSHFDLVLDLADSATLNLELLPAGYFHIGDPELGDNATKLVDALAQLPELIGHFDKPRYVQINSDICAHSGSGLSGCQRCLTVCPADAISSDGQHIQVDTHLCHGAGSCASVCPTGAMQYDQPTAKVLQDYLHRLLSRYQQLSNQAPVILFHDGSGGTALLQQLQQLPAGVLPIELEEIAVAGSELWLAALAWGARQVIVLTHEATPASLRAVVESEHQTLTSVFNACGIALERLQLLALDADTSLALVLPEMVAASAALTPMPSAAFGTKLAKRDTFYNALDHLNGCHTGCTERLDIRQVPYGQVVVDTDKCTLCLSCAALCPAQALQDGGEQPALKFTEQSCVQCGLCEQACPEGAIRLQAGILLDRGQRQQQQVLKEEVPFECITCGKPFATHSVITKMTNALAGHSAFAGSAIERLKMCEDCRVKDMFSDIIADPEKQLRV